MTGRKRITIEVNVDANGWASVNLYLNPAARERLIAELQKLDREDDHFHVFDYDPVGDGLALSQIAYGPDASNMAGELKVLLRYDDWDEEHYPHVMAPIPDPFEA